MNYVSSQANRFYKIHTSPTPAIFEKDKQGKDNGIEWWQAQKWESLGEHICKTVEFIEDLPEENIKAGDRGIIISGTNQDFTNIYEKGTYSYLIKVENSDKEITVLSYKVNICS